MTLNPLTFCITWSAQQAMTLASQDSTMPLLPWRTGGIAQETGSYPRRISL